MGSLGLSDGYSAFLCFGVFAQWVRALAFGFCIRYLHLLRVSRVPLGF